MDTTENTTPTTETLRENRPRPGDGYRRLRSFQLSTIIYDATVSFCNRFVDRRSRTHDRMVQAARSGRQYIAKGSRAGATSSKTETHLTNVARGTSPHRYTPDCISLYTVLKTNRAPSDSRSKRANGKPALR